MSMNPTRITTFFAFGMDIEIPQELLRRIKPDMKLEIQWHIFTLLPEHPLKINTLDIIQPFLLSFGSII